MIRTLGLDMGPNSIGWALVEENEDGSAGRIVDLGVRVFPEGVDAFDSSKETPKNETRRIKRGMRRSLSRRSRRETTLRHALIECGLWPASPEAQSQELAKDPFLLRARAVTEQLSLHELGRVLLHLSRRRGFLSNRKKDVADNETKGLLAEINEYEKQRADGGFETIGAYLSDQKERFVHTDPASVERVRNRHLSRAQIAHEFQVIWDRQHEFHPNTLTERLRYGELGPVHSRNPRTGENEVTIAPRRSIARRDPRRTGRTDLQSFGLFGILFFQRPMYWPKSVVGLCELEPNQKRCPRADRVAEKFRIYQELNNLRYLLDGEERSLSEQQRTVALDQCTSKSEVTFDGLRKALQLTPDIRFNLERGSRSSIKGMVVDQKLKKIVGRAWGSLTDDEKTSLVRTLINDDIDENHKISRLSTSFGLSVDVAEKLVGVDLPTGYVSLSRRAIERLLPYLQKGLVYQSKSDPATSALHAAGYLRRDELARRLFDVIPDFSRLSPQDCRLGNIPNPVVKRALVELRKVVNAIIREYGKPDAVHVELARSVQMGTEKRKKASKLMRGREKSRDEAAEAVRNFGVAVRRDSILRWLLWTEQCHTCLYCAQPISLAQLLGGTVDVDHIIPYSRCLDDSQGNKVVCHQRCNHEKAQRTPYEWLAVSQPDRYSAMTEHASRLVKEQSLPYAKLKRIQQKSVDLDHFIARQLTDTGYITSATVELLQLLFEKPHAVLGLKGQLTAELRHQWGLDTILSEFPNSPAWEGDPQNKLRPGEKNRADHRHHTIDAIVVALTNRRRLQRLSRMVKAGGMARTGEVLETPWDDFRASVSERLAAVYVSHRVERKVAGALHEETLYGRTHESGSFVVRKSVETLTPAEIERIRDPAIRRLILKRLSESGIVVDGILQDSTRIKQALVGLTMPSGVPIRKVRVLKNDNSVVPLRDSEDDSTPFVKPGSNHHVCLFEVGENGQIMRCPVFVTMIEAYRRVRDRSRLILREHPNRSNARFLFSLSRRELVLAEVDGRERLLQFRTAISTDGRMRFVDHADARRSKYAKLFYYSPSTLRARKVTVDLLGRIRWAND
jgi:CRISPR-associated endonuclease Csn1